MADTLVKPIELAVPAGEVGQESAKQTNQPVQRKIVGPLSLHPSARISLAKPILTAKPDIDIELAEIGQSLASISVNQQPRAVYIYLSSVFAVIMRWRRLNCAVKNSKAALRLRPDAPQMKSEPFAIVIFCTSDPEVVDAKTRSKWSRVLRYAAQSKACQVSA